MRTSARQSKVERYRDESHKKSGMQHGVAAQKTEDGPIDCVKDLEDGGTEIFENEVTSLSGFAVPLSHRSEG